MKLNDIIWTDKMRAVMKDEARILFLTGATGCSKTLVAGHKFMDWLLNAPADDTQFYMIFKDRGSLRIISPISFFNAPYISLLRYFGANTM